MSEFALSTSWNASRRKDARSIIYEITSCGFDSVELNFTLAREVVEDISRMVKEAKIRVRSLHNYCPVPDGVKPEHASPDYYSLASLDEEERSEAVYHTKETIEAAKELGAEAVVIHCGKVKEHDSTRNLIQLVEDGRKGSDEYRAIIETMRLDRSAKAAPHLDRAVSSLRELCPFALDRGITLGIENRFYFMEMPSIDEIGIILERVKSPAVRYWHDVGHAQVQEELGLARHKDFLERYSSQAAGMHFHDVIGTKDHIAPGRGSFDFSILKPYLNNSIIKVIEPHGIETADDIRNASRYLSKTLGVDAE